MPPESPRSGEPTSTLPDATCTEEIRSCLYAQLRKCAEKVTANPKLRAHPFLSELATGEPPVLPEDIHRYCLETEPTDLLWEISAAMKRAGMLSEWGAGEDAQAVRDLVAHMCLVAGQRWIQQEITGKPLSAHDLPHVPMVEELAAAVVAATWLDLGLQLRFGAGGRIEVANLITDRAETQFGVKTVEQTIDDEIARMVTDFLAPPQSAADDRRQRRHPSEVRAGIRKMESQIGVRPIVGLGPSVVRSNVDGALRQRIQDRWGIEIFLYGQSDAPVDSNQLEEWEQIQGSLMEHFEGILSPLYRSNGGEPSTGGVDTGGSKMKRAKVFISYAHKDERYREYLREHLGVLEGQGLVDVWDDRSIGAGDDWCLMIDEQLKTCKVAVFLVSAAFLRSQFILKEEVPSLLKRHQQEGMHVVPVLIRLCAWKIVDWLAAMQMRPNDAEPLASATRKRDAQLARVALEIADLCKR